MIVYRNIQDTIIIRKNVFFIDNNVLELFPIINVESVYCPYIESVFLIFL